MKTSLICEDVGEGYDVRPFVATDDIVDLDDLLCSLRARQVPLGDDLPTFGGDEPRDTREIWSWDAERLLVGTCPGDLEIVDRPVR